MKSQSANQGMGSLSNYIHQVSFEQFESREEREQTEVLPDGMSELVFLINSSYDRIQKDTKVHKLDAAHIIGLKSGSCKVKLNQGLDAISVRFKPGALSCFTSLDMKKITDQVVMASDIFGPGINKLEDKLHTIHEQIEQELAILKFLESRLNENHKNCELRFLLQEFYKLKAQTSLKALISSSADYKRLERLFNRYLGISPKKFLQIVQFNYALSLL